MTVVSGNTTVEAEIPARILEEMRSLVAQGWFRDLNELVTDALRRFLESHRPDLQEELLKEDIEWGLRGTSSSSSPLTRENVRP